MKQDEIEIIKQVAGQLNSKKDLLNLLNIIKKIEFENAVPFRLQQLTYHCNPKLNSQRYITFSIPKKVKGEFRTIMAPNNGLKMLQHCVNVLLQVIYVPNEVAYGFVKNKSIVDNAKCHINQNYVFNIDLKDFFPSIEQARVWKCLQLKPFNFNKEISSIIAGLCCHHMEIESNEDKGGQKKIIRSVLPQGAPTSPIITNIVCRNLDRRLTGLAKRFGLHYSRYADDITFSSMHYVYKKDDPFRNELERIINDQRFHINTNKTRLNGNNERQEVTGLTVSSKVNVTKKYIKQIRTILHNWEMDGYNVAYEKFCSHYRQNKPSAKGQPNMANVVRGKLDFLRMVKGSEDSTYKKLEYRFNNLITSQETKDAETEKLINDISNALKSLLT